MFFAVSKIGWLLAQPVGMIGLCFALIAVLAFWRKARAVGVFAVLGLLLVILAGQTNLGRLLLQPLENAYPRPQPEPAPDEIAGVIVLGGGFVGHITRARGGFELGESGDRFVESLRLARVYPDVPIVISGGEASLLGSAEGDAPIATRFFSGFGVAPDRLILEDKSRNTYENALFTKQRLPEAGTKRWLLVTSAFHMPRSVGVFERQGIDIIPWPVDYRSDGRETFAFGRDDPAQALSDLSLALREWIGIIAYKMTGKTDRVVP